MPGVRVQHPTVRNARYTIVEGDKPYPKPINCPRPDLGGCGTTHLFKTHHLNVEEDGSVIINTVLFERIKPLIEQEGFVIANEVAKPPTMGIGAAGRGQGVWGNIPIIRPTGNGAKTRKKGRK